MSCAAKCKSTGRRQCEALCPKNIPLSFQINFSPFNTSINLPASKQLLIYLYKIKDILLRGYICQDFVIAILSVSEICNAFT